MKKSFNLGAIIVGLILLIVGLVFVITQYSILVNIGCSLIASGIVLGEHATANIGQISVQMMAVSSIDVISNSNQKETIQIFYRKGNAFER